MVITIVYLLNCPLVLSLLKYRDVGAFFNKKNEDPKLVKPLK